jgi:phage terminase small subunit
LQSQALRLEKELGMTPQARAKLGVNLARTADLAQAMSNPDPVKRAQQLRELGLGDDTDE